MKNAWGKLFFAHVMILVLFVFSCCSAFAASGTVVYENVTTNERLTVDASATLTMVLKGNNYFNNGITVPYGSTLIIEGDGSLTANSSGYFRSGIGSADTASGNPNDCGTIIINSGTITAGGGYYATAIGGATVQKLEINGGVINTSHMIGAEEGNGNIIINGGQIHVDAGGHTGINCGDNGRLNIFGGDITVTGEIHVGVGGGVNSEINIWGGTVTVNSDGNWEACIGGGENSSITINGGTVNAHSFLASFGYGGAGIGGGKNCRVTINGGNVTAHSSYYGAAIGGNSGVDGGTININGGSVTAYAYKTGSCIGGGDSANGGDVTISGGNVTAIWNYPYGQITAPDVIGKGVGGSSSGTLIIEPHGSAIQVKVGQKASDAVAISGSPFLAQTNITSYVSGKKYFQSTDPNTQYEVDEWGELRTEHSIVVAEAKEGQINPYGIKGATITIDGEVFTTDSNGMVLTNKFGERTVTISANGYREQKLTYLLTESSSRLFFLEKETNDGKPYMVQVEGYAGVEGFDIEGGGVVDLRYQALHYTQNDDAALRIETKANWNGHEKGIIYLFQGDSLDTATKTLELKDGSITTFNPGKTFEPGKDVKLQMVAGDGTLSDIVKLNLYINYYVKITDGTSNETIEEGINSYDWLGSRAVPSDDKDVVKIFPVDNSFSIDSVPFEVKIISNDDGSKTMRGIIGFDSMSGVTNKYFSKGSEKEFGSDHEWTELKKDLNSLFTNKDKYYRQLKNKYIKELHPSRLRQRIDTDLDLLGYLDINTRDGELISEDGRIVIKGEGKWIAGQTLFVGPGIPVYFELKAGIGVDAGFEATIINQNGWNLKETAIKASVDMPSITAGAGVGVRGVATLGVEGILKHTAEFDGTDTIGKLSSEAAVKAKVLFVGDFGYTLGYSEDVVWTSEYVPSSGDGSGGGFTGGGGDGFGGGTGGGRSITEPIMLLSVLNDMQPMDVTVSLASREYLNNESEWLPISVYGRFRALPNTGLTLLQNGTMPDAMPRIHVVGDKIVMLFLKDVASRQIGNHTQLVYSVYDDGVWSEPKAVWESETADFFFDSTVVDDQLYVAWQKSSVKTNSNDPEELLAQVVQNSEIAFAAWDDENEEFIQQQYLTSDQTVDMLPSIAASDEGVSVIWVSNDQNNVMGTGGKNTINKLDIHNGQAGEKEDLYTTEQFIAETSAGSIGRNVHVVFSTQNADGTVDVHHLDDGKYASVMINTSSAGIAFENESFLWQADGTLYQYDPEKQTVAEMVSSERAAVSSSYQYVSNGKNTAIVWHETADGVTSLMASVCENNKWSAPVVLLSDVGNKISFFDAEMLDDGRFAVVINTADLTENGYENTALKFALIDPKSDIELTSAIVGKPDWTKDQQEVTFAVKNNGTSTVRSIVLKIADDQKTYLNKTVSLELAPGDTAYLTETVSLAGFTTIVSPTASAQMTNDTDNSNNSENITLGHVDVGLAVEAYEYNNCVFFLCTAANNSHAKASTTLSIIEDSRDGKVLEAVNTGVISNKDTVQYLYTVDREEIDFGDDGLKTYFFRLDSSESDWNEENNLRIYTVSQRNLTRTLPLSGTVSIEGSAVYGEMLTASVSNTNNTGNLTYTWKRDGSEVATGQTYTLSKEDIGKSLICEVTSSIETGSIAGATAVIAKQAGPAAPTNLMGIAPTGFTTQDGKIVGTTAELEFALDDSFTSPVDCGNGETTGLAAGIYYVRYKETDTAYAGEIATVTVPEFVPNALTGTVTITGNAVYGQTLTATVSNTNNTGVLTYSWKRDGGDVATGESYTLTVQDIGKSLTCEVTSSIETGSIAGATDIVEKQAGPAAPTNLTGVAPTGFNTKDGKIVGTTAEMELAADSSFASSINCGNGETTGLAAGIYYVRYKETDTAYAGEAVTVTIPEFVPNTLTGTVTITGSAVYGQTLTASVSNTNNTGVLTYSWKRDGSDVATGESYTLTVQDIGKSLICEVTSSIETGSIVGATLIIAKQAGPAAPTNLMGVAPTGFTTRDGKIVGTTAEMELATDSSFTSPVGCGNGETTGLVEGTYYVRYKETDTAYAGEIATVTVPEFVSNALTGTVTITGNAVYGQTLTASVSNTNNTGVLTYAWKRDDRVVTTGESYTLTADDVGKIIICEVTSSVETGSIAGATEIVAKQSGPVAPTGLTGIAPTSSANDDGKIIGTIEEMEYALSEDFSDAKSCGDGETISLVPGTYYVRIRETTTTEAGEYVIVMIPEYVKKSPVIQYPENDQTVNVEIGNTANMSVMADHAVNYQWFVDRNDGKGFVEISGATSAVYTTAAVKAENDGYRYFCRVSNADGYVDSPIFMLQVIQTVNLPDTGDHSRLMLWMMVAALSIAVITLMSRKQRIE